MNVRAYDAEDDELFVDDIDPALCVRYENFFLHHEHLKRLHEVKRLHRETDSLTEEPISA